MKRLIVAAGAATLGIVLGKDSITGKEVAISGLKAYDRKGNTAVSPGDSGGTVITPEGVWEGVASTASGKQPGQKSEDLRVTDEDIEATVPDVEVPDGKYDIVTFETVTAAQVDSMYGKALAAPVCTSDRPVRVTKVPAGKPIILPDGSSIG